MYNETEEEILDRAVPASAIQAVLDEAERWSSNDFEHLTMTYSRNHPMLLAFAMEVFLDLQEQARNQSLLTLITLIHIFEKHYGSHYERITESGVTRAVNRNGYLVVNTVNRQQQRRGDVVQPFLLQFISDVLFDFEPDEMPSERDAFSMLLVLMTALDLLDRAYARRGANRELALASR
jgi:hypothetical protein